MLKALTITFLACGLLACEANGEVIEYCAEKSPVRISINFEERLIRVVDETGNSQVVSRAFSCSDGTVEHCFAGYITIFDPRFAARPSDEDKIEIVDQAGKLNSTIRITNSTSQISYDAYFKGAWPARLSAKFFDEMESDEFNLC